MTLATEGAVLETLSTDHVNPSKSGLAWPNERTDGHFLAITRAAGHARRTRRTGRLHRVCGSGGGRSRHLATPRGARALRYLANGARAPA